MVRGGTIGSLVVATIFALGGSASAAAPKVVVTSVDVTVQDAYFTDLCGAPIDFFNVGTFKAKLYMDRSGAIVREIDTTQGDVAGWTNEVIGATISFPATAALTTDYRKGITPGSPATVTGNGIAGKIPGLPADAGQAVFAGHVAFVDPEGVPIVVFDQLVSTTGHWNDPAAFEAAVCAALV